MYEGKIKVFTEAAVFAAAVTTGFWICFTYSLEGTSHWVQAIERGLCVLIICIPLPLRLAEHTVLSEGRKVLESHKIQIASPQSLEKLGTIDTIVFSRTEVITEDIDGNIKDDAIEAIVMIGAIVGSTILITEEDRNVAETIAKRGGVSTIYSNLSPEEKIEIVNALVNRGKSVAVVGDGEEDEMLMSAAKVAIAIGGTGTADVTIYDMNLLKVEEAILIGRAALKSMRVSFVWALIYDIIWGLAAAGALDFLYKFSVRLWAAVLLAAVNAAILLANSLMLKKKIL